VLPRPSTGFGPTYDRPVSRTALLPLPGATVSRAGPGDVVELVVLQRCCWVTEAITNDTLAIPALHESHGEVERWVAEMAVWVVRSAGRLVGAVRAQRDGHRWEIGRLMVAPDLTGRGLGRWLLAHAEAHAPAGVTELCLVTGLRSERNQQLYARAGYTRQTPPPGSVADVEPGVVFLAKPRSPG
jgi:GNAT superfamily N-acetyltransferase